MHVSEQLQALWQLVCRHHNIGLFDEVGPQVNVLLTKEARNVDNLLNLALRGVEVRTEVVPVEYVFGLRS